MFEPIGKDIANKKQTGGLGRSVEAAVIIAKANQCGQGRWQAVRFRHGRLTVVAPSAGQAQELALTREAARASINQALGQPLVKQLIVRS